MAQQQPINVATDQTTHVQLKKLANREGLKMKDIPRVLLAGWRRLPRPEQEAARSEAFGQRQPLSKSA